MILIVIINVRIGYQPKVLIDKGDTIQYELVKELRGLKHALDQDADLEMQDIYPEGFVFLNAVSALAWSSFVDSEKHRKYFEEGHAEVHKAWTKVTSPVGKAPFSEGLSLPYGSFYNGWNTYVLALKLRLDSTSMRKIEEIRLFQQQCDGIAKAIQERTYPPSYYGGVWPADVVLCVAALSLHDELFEPRYKGVIDQWLRGVKRRLDVRGMIPHSLHPANGTVQENARGSSMALMLIFLQDIDLQFAQEQFVLFKANFLDSVFGLTGIREYPKGDPGPGDIDSGPVILGFGGAATIVGMQTLSIFDEHELSLRIRKAIEAMAFPLQNEHYKQYFFGKLPIADAFIAWSHSRMQMPSRETSFVQFRLYSLFAFVILSISFWILIRNKGDGSKTSQVV